MGASPKLNLKLMERTGKGELSLGYADLTLAAATAISEGQGGWDSRAVPASIEACKAMTHRARIAAWEGRLYSPDLPHAFTLFAEAVERVGGAQLLSFHLSVLDAAKRIHRQSEWLLDTVTRAYVADPAGQEFFSHPLTGETFRIGDEDMLEGIPFAFSAVRAVFQGIDPKSLADFVFAGEGCNATDFLEFCVKKPEQWFRDVEGLESDIAAYFEDKNFKAFTEAVQDWNRRQDVRPLVGDTRSILLLSPLSDLESSIDWCKDHMDMASDLVDGILKGFDH